MSQNNGQYPPQPGYPQQGQPQPGYPQQGQPQPGYPQQGQPQPGYGQMPNAGQPGQAPQQQNMGADALRGLFTGVGGAEVGSGARYPNIETPGLYNVEVAEVKVIKSKTNPKTFLVCEFKLVNSSSTNHAEGQMHSWVHNMNNQHFGLANAKQWAAAILGLAHDSPEAMAINENTMIQLVSNPDAVKGKFATVMCRMHTTKQMNQNTGQFNTIPVLDWHPFNPQAEVPTPQPPAAPAPVAAPQQMAPQGGQPMQQGYPPQGGQPMQQGYPPQGGQPMQQGYPPQGGQPMQQGYPPQGGQPMQPGAQPGYPNGGYQGGN